MKNLYKLSLKIFYLLCCVIMLSACTQKPQTLIRMPNPWTDCRDNLECAGKIAGFEFPLTLSNLQVRAIKDMIEVTYPLDEFRDVVVRKTTEDLYNKIDISGDYNNYPIKDTLTLDNGVNMLVRRDNNLIYVAYLGASTGYYSINCSKGMTKKELQQVYSIIAEVEAPKIPSEAFN